MSHITIFMKKTEKQILLQTAMAFIIIFSSVPFHEIGHYIVAKKYDPYSNIRIYYGLFTAHVSVYPMADNSINRIAIAGVWLQSFYFLIWLFVAYFLDLKWLTLFMIISIGYMFLAVNPMMACSNQPYDFKLIYHC